MNHDQQDETNISRQQELQQERESFRLHQEEKRLETARRGNTFKWIVNSIFWLTGMLEILLVIRFLLRLFGANPKNDFALIINNLSMPFIAPFSTLFISPTTNSGTNIFDLNIVVAIVVYALLSYLMVSLVRFILYHEP